MPAHYRVALYSFITTLVLLVSLAAPIMASADDGAPPPETTPEIVITTEEAPPPGGAAENVSIPEILEQAPAGTELVVLDEAGEALPLSSDAAAEVLATGDPLWCPAGVTPANDADDLDQDCTNSFATFGDESTAGTLLYELHTNSGSYNGAGTIYVETSYAGEAGNNVDIDTSSIGGGSLSDLVIEGGWNGLFGGAATFGGTTNFGTTSLYVYNWNGSVSIYNIVIDGSQDGLQIQSYGDVVLDNVASNNTTDYNGIDIETQGDLTADNVTANGNEYDGMSASAMGEVSITNGEFVSNGVNAHYYEDPGLWTVLTGASGLTVFANGNITLAQTDATGNGLHGADLNNYDGGDVSVTGGSFSNNGHTGDLYDYLSVSGEYTYFSSWLESGSGLSIDTSTGDITVAGVTANDNADHGGIFYSSTGDIHVSESEFNGNGAIGSGFAYVNDADYGQSMYLDYQAGNGLFNYTDGSVTLAGVVAVSNANNGAEAYIDGDLEVTDSLFADNGWSNGIFECALDELCGYDWLYELMFSDAVNGYSAVPGLCEDDNAPTFDFFIFNPCSEDLAYIEVSGPNFSFGAGSFSGESYYIESWDLSLYGGAGLLAGADGSIVLDEVGAFENSETGADLFQTSQGTAPITITDSEFSANGGYPSESGFMGGTLFVGETVSIEGEEPELEYSGGFGFSYGNGLGVSADYGKVTLTNVEAYSNAAAGAAVYTEGTLLVQGNDEISFSDNGNMPIFFAGEGLFGEFLDEVGIFGLTICCTLEIPASGMYLDFYLASDLYSEPDNFAVYADLFSGSGLEGEATGGVTLNDVYAYANGGYGADLWTAGNASITTGEFSGNGEGMQAWLDLCFGDEDCNYIEFYLSPSSGLSVNAGGEVTVTGVQASGNMLYGAELYSDAPDSVVVNESGFFANGYGTGVYVCDAEDPEYCDEVEEFWGGSGVYVDTSGNIYMNYVTASGNITDGAELNSGGSAAICNSEFQGNGDYGVDAWGVNGSLTLSDVVFGGNGSGDYDYDGVAVETSGFNCNPPNGGGGPDVPGLPWNIVPVDGGEQVGLNCDAYAGTYLKLDNGDHAILPCPIQDIGVLTPTGADALPGEVGDDYDFASGFALEVLREGAAVDVIQDGIATVAFTIPEGVSADDLAILWWNGAEWVPLHEVEGDGRVVYSAGFVTEDGFFAASVNFTGTFILVQK